MDESQYFDEILCYKNEILCYKNKQIVNCKPCFFDKSNQICKFPKRLMQNLPIDFW